MQFKDKDVPVAPHGAADSNTQVVPDSFPANVRLQRLPAGIEQTLRSDPLGGERRGVGGLTSAVWSGPSASFSGGTLLQREKKRWEAGSDWWAAVTAKTRLQDMHQCQDEEMFRRLSNSSRSSPEQTGSRSCSTWIWTHTDLHPNLAQTDTRGSFSGPDSQTPRSGGGKGGRNGPTGWFWHHTNRKLREILANQEMDHSADRPQPLRGVALGQTSTF